MIKNKAKPKLYSHIILSYVVSVIKMMGAIARTMRYNQF